MKNILALCLLVTLNLFSQERKEYHYLISYVAASTVYIAAGYEQRIEVGDTLKIFRDSKEIGNVAVTAVARRTSIAQILVQHIPFLVGDDAVVMKTILRQPNDTIMRMKGDTVHASNEASPIVHPNNTSAENIVSGRVALQFNELVANDSHYNLSQPAALFRLSIRNLFGYGMQLSMDDRSYYDPTNTYTQYGNTAGAEHRLYELSLRQDRPDAPIGFGVGRMTSSFVGGMGAFDGFQFYYRQNEFTVGVLGGAQVNDPTSVLSNTGTKGSLFLNYRTGPDIFHYYDGTLAYGRQMVSNKLDREFLYIQNTFAVDPALSFYESSEIELDQLTNGVITPAFNFSNTNVSANYYPVEWFSANLGYDATRPVYLFETMKSTPDSLFDKNLLQGYRATVTFHLPLSMTLSELATYRAKQDTTRDAHMFTTALRITDIFDTEFNPGIRYSNIVGEYSTGEDIAFDIDRSFGNNIDLSFRYDYTTATIALLHQTYTTKTVSANIYYAFSPMWYASLALDDVIDATLGDYQGLIEIGIRF
ncbi:MAG: hypothetical protein WBW71_07280 [Bacteroidota bacterium]